MSQHYRNEFLDNWFVVEKEAEEIDLLSRMLKEITFARTCFPCKHEEYDRVLSGKVMAEFNKMDELLNKLSIEATARLFELGDGEK